MPSAKDDRSASTHRQCDDYLCRTLGVIDLSAARAVHAIAGQRSEYKPLQCELTSSGDAVELAEGYLRMGVGGLYVADLDAIESSGSNEAIIRELADLDCPLWIDCGTRTLPLAIKRHDVVSIIGTESIDAVADIKEIAQQIPVERIALSLDLMNGQLRFRDRKNRSVSLTVAVQRAAQIGVRRFIVLELSAVGTALGPPTAEICRRIKHELPDTQIISGGGVRSARDLQILEKSGCERFLIGTALHGGRKKFVFGAGSC